MNADDRALLERVEYALRAIPLPVAGSGTQSQGIAGFISYGHDMGVAKPLIEVAMRMIRGRGHPSFDEWDQEQLDEALVNLEGFVKRRVSEHWCDWSKRTRASMMEDNP